MKFYFQVWFLVKQLRVIEYKGIYENPTVKKKNTENCEAHNLQTSAVRRVPLCTQYRLALDQFSDPI